MKNQHIHFIPTRANEMDFGELYGETSNDWQEKARKLQVSRWRALKRSMKGL